MLRLTALAAVAAVTLAPVPAPKKPAVRAPARVSARVLTIAASNYAFDVADTIAAGRTEIQLTNKGPELHHVWLVKLDAGKHVADALDAFAKNGAPPAWMHDV